MGNGWIKIYRQMWDNPHFNKPAYLSVWIWILTHTEHGMKKEKGVWLEKAPNEMPSVMWNGVRRHLKRGEFTLGAYRISEDTGVPRGTVERIIKTFKNEEQIEVETSNKFSLGRVWKLYQSSEEVSEEQVRNKRGTSEDVTKKIKNIKNEREVEQSSPTPAQKSRDFFSSKENLAKQIEFLERKGITDADSEMRNFVSYWTELNKSGTKQRWELEKTFELSRRVATWFRNSGKW